MTTSPPPDRVTAIYDAIEAFQREHRTVGGLQHAQIRASLAEHLDGALPVPPPADRAAVLREAAEAVTGYAADHFPDEYDEYADQLADVLRRLAAEAQQPEVPSCDGAGEPAELRGLPREVRRLVHAVDRMRSDWAEAPEHGPERRDLWTEVHSACDAVWDRLDSNGAEAQQQESGSGCAHCVCCHAWGDREAHAALVRDDGAEAPQPETCRNCRGSGLDPRYNGEYACPDCAASHDAEAPQPDTETRAPVPQPDVCDTCDTERCETCHGCRCNKGDDNTCGHPDCPATRVKHSGPDTKFCVLCLSGEHERIDEEA